MSKLKSWLRCAEKEEQNAGAWIAIGIAIGTAFGVTIDNIALGVAFGAGLGGALSAIASQRSEKGDKNTHRDDD